MSLRFTQATLRERGLAHRIILSCITPHGPGAAMLGEVGREVDNKPLGARDSGGHPRTAEERLTKGLFGFFAEAWFRAMLEHHFENLELTSGEPTVHESGEFEQIDFTATGPRGSRTIEARSSFPYYGLKSAIFKNFDVLGPYVNPVKTSELDKDYYARILYNIGADRFPRLAVRNADGSINYRHSNTKVLTSEILSETGAVKSPFYIAFVGGATRDQMYGTESYVKDLATQGFASDAQFRCLKISKSMDALAFLTALQNDLGLSIRRR